MQSAAALVAQRLLADLRYHVWRFELRSYRLSSRSTIDSER